MPHVRRRWLVASACGIAGLFATAGLTVGAQAAPVRPAASTATAADLVNYLKSSTGSRTLSGQEDGPNSAPSTWQNKVHDITGEYPAIWGGDFAFEQNDIDNRQTVINQAISEWNSGSIPALMWHVCPPEDGPNSCHWNYGTGPITSPISDSDWNQLITDGTPLNNAWKARLDEVVPYFQQLKDRGIPVLFRFLHEMDEGWAWWGGRPGPNGSAKLYQISHDYLESKGLTNIVWVWNVKDLNGADPSTAAQYYPGDQYVDVVTLDPWYEGFPSTAWYDEMQSIAGSKPIALAEVGPLPTPAQLASQPKWTYWSVWIDYLTSSNSNQTVKNIYYDDPPVLHQGEVNISSGGGSTGGTTGGGGGSPTGQITGYGGLCVDVQGANSTNFTPVQVYTCNGTNAQQWTVNASNNTLQALGKCLDVYTAGTANGTKVDLYDCNGTGAQTWVPQSNGSLLNPNSGKCLDDTNWSTTAGTQLQIWDCTANANQQWSLPS